MHPVTNSDAPNEKSEEKVPQMPWDLKSIPKPLESFGRMKAKVQIKHYELWVKCRENYSIKSHLAVQRWILLLGEAKKIVKFLYPLCIFVVLHIFFYAYCSCVSYTYCETLKRIKLIFTKGISLMLARWHGTKSGMQRVFVNPFSPTELDTASFSTPKTNNKETKK